MHALLRSCRYILLTQYHGWPSICARYHWHRFLAWLFRNSGLLHDYLVMQRASSWGEWVVGSFFCACCFRFCHSVFVSYKMAFLLSEIALTPVRLLVLAQDRRVAVGSRPAVASKLPAQHLSSSTETVRMDQLEDICLCQECASTTLETVCLCPKHENTELLSSCLRQECDRTWYCPVRLRQECEHRTLDTVRLRQECDTQLEIYLHLQCTHECSLTFVQSDCID